MVCFLAIVPKTLGFIVLVLGWLVVGDGLQLGDVADTFRHPLSEKHLCSHLQIFWVLDELEENDCFLSCPQLLLWFSDVAKRGQWVIRVKGSSSTVQYQY